ncbi:MAG: DUF4131 domain-containing protein [Clostridia bacterium]|nr:DUF4131 domain-containing protein [Clostridia bacterium]
MKRPICIATISSIIGIIMGLYCSGIATFLCWILVVTTLTLLLIQIYHKIAHQNRNTLSQNQAHILQIILIFCIFSHVFLCYTIFLENRYQNIYKTYNEKNLHIQATVVFSGEEKEYKYVYKIRVNQVNHEKIKPIYLLLQVKKEQNNSLLTYGNEIVLQTTYQKPEVARNEGGFDASNYLKMKGISGTISSSANDITVLKKEKPFFLGKTINELKTKIKQNLNQLFSKDIARLSSRTDYWRKTRY